jgi:hypothetical protein
MAYLPKRRRGLRGFGDDCSDMGGATQPDGTCEITISGSGTAPPAPGITPTTTTTFVPTATTSSTPSFFSTLFAAAAPKPGVPVAATGMSTTTMLLIGGVGVLALALFMKKGS